MRARELAALRQGWGWTGIEFAEIVASSLFGHLLVTDRVGTFHYVDPDILGVQTLGDEAAAKTHMELGETQAIWRADAHVEAADKRLGAPRVGEVYGFTPQALVAGDYAPENMVCVELAAYIRMTGDLADQIKDLPEGAHVRIKVTD